MELLTRDRSIYDKIRDLYFYTIGCVGLFVG